MTAPHARKARNTPANLANPQASCLTCRNTGPEDRLVNPHCGFVNPQADRLTAIRAGLRVYGFDGSPKRATAGAQLVQVRHTGCGFASFAGLKSRARTEPTAMGAA